MLCKWEGFRRNDSTSEDSDNGGEFDDLSSTVLEAVALHVGGCERAVFSGVKIREDEASDDE